MGERLAAIMGADFPTAAGAVGVAFLKAVLVSALNRTWRGAQAVVRDSDHHIALDHGIAVTSVRRARAALVQLGVVRIVSRHSGGIVHWTVDYRRLVALQRRKPEPTTLSQSAVEHGTALSQSAVGQATALPESAVPRPTTLPQSAGALSQSADPRNKQGNFPPPPPPAPVDAPRTGRVVGVEGLSARASVRRERADPPAPLRLADAAGLAALLALGAMTSKARSVAAQRPDEELGAVARAARKKSGVKDPAGWAIAALERGDGEGILAQERAEEAARAARESGAAGGLSGTEGASPAAKGAAERANLRAAAGADPTAAWLSAPENAAARAELLAEFREGPARGSTLTDDRILASGVFLAWAARRIGVAA
jgi:hypothetical protein